MHRTAWFLLLLFAFAIPWEYSLDWGPPFGHVARLAGLALIAVIVPLTLGAGGLRRPGLSQWIALAFYLWVCCTCLWSADQEATGMHMRGYVQEILPLWLIWELARTPRDLRDLLRATVAGEWLLALLTIASLATLESAASEQIRFVAAGQDPNDVARFLDLGFPLAALLTRCEKGWAGRLLAWGYLPLGAVAVLLTASRGGFMAAVVALGGSAVVLVWRRPWVAAAAAGALPAMVALAFVITPRGTFERLATIPEQLGSGDLNLRMNIWQAGWQAFLQAPFLGHGMGAFTVAARTAPEDTAHNTALSLAVGGGVVAVVLASALVVVAVVQAFRTRGLLRWALVTALAAWLVTASVSTVEESRTSWLLLGLVAFCGRMAGESPAALELFFAPQPAARPALTAGQTA